LTTYPGIDDGDKLRAWLRPVVLDISTLTSLTKNTIDDTIARTAIHIIDNDKSWLAVYSILTLAHDHGSNGAVKIPTSFEMKSKVVDAYYDISEIVQVENPAVVIAAIGLIIQLIQLLRK
jgi:hypothetical protein